MRFDIDDSVGSGDGVAIRVRVLQTRTVHKGEFSALFSCLGLGELLRRLPEHELLEHWQQGEFHHDLLIRIGSEYLIVATNCNGGVKEILLFDEPPQRWALWNWRCPENPEFEGAIPEIKQQYRTSHWFDPCVLLADDARSEFRAECRRRVRGGGWELA